MFWMFPSSNIPQSIDQIIIKLCRGFITILIIWISYAGRGEKSKTCRPGGPWGLELMSDLWHKKSPPWAHGQVALLIVFFFFSWAVLNQSLHVTLDYNSIKSIQDEITFNLCTSMMTSHSGAILHADFTIGCPVQYCGYSPHVFVKFFLRGLPERMTASWRAIVQLCWYNWSLLLSQCGLSGCSHPSGIVWYC